MDLQGLQLDKVKFAKVSVNTIICDEAIACLANALCALGFTVLKLCR